MDLSLALDFDLFDGDFGYDGDRELRNKIVKFRKVGECHICIGEIKVGETGRSSVWCMDGKLLTYRICNECCVAIIESEGWDDDDDDDDSDEIDPIERRYNLGHERS